MFKNQMMAILVREDMLNVSVLLTRSWAKVVAPSHCSEEEKINYKNSIESIIGSIRQQVLDEIFDLHPDLRVVPVSTENYED